MAVIEKISLKDVEYDIQDANAVHYTTNTITNKTEVALGDVDLTVNGQIVPRIFYGTTSTPDTTTLGAMRPGDIYVQIEETSSSSNTEGTDEA